MTLATLGKQYREIAEKLGAPEYYCRFATTPQHDGSPHIEVIGDQFHFVVTERGSEFERRKTTDPQDILFWLVSGLTFGMACEWELKHRIEGEDSRRQLFQKQIDLLSQVNQDWAERMRESCKKILEEHPFEDRAANL